MAPGLVYDFLSTLLGSKTVTPPISEPNSQLSRRQTADFGDLPPNIIITLF